jgi:hypothetical protein
VVVDSDLSVGQGDADALTTVQISILRTDGEHEIVHARPLVVSAAPNGPLEFTLPLSFALTPQGLDEGALFRVVVTGQNGLGEDIAERQVITGFRKGASLRLDMFLAAACLRELCREQNLRTALTCDADKGACARTPELKDLPVVVGSGVGGYERLSVDGGAVWDDDASAKKCVRDSDCDDGLYCNGLEACDPGSLKANSFGCVAGAAPSCGVRETCEEASDRCTACAQNADGDGDLVAAKACGGSDCNDGDPAIAPGKDEICDGKDNDCDERTDATSSGGVCSVATGGSDAGVGDRGVLDAAAREAGAEGGAPQLDAGDAAKLDAGKEAGTAEAGLAEAGAPDANVPLVSACRMGSTMACSSFINAWDVEVTMGSYGSVMEPNVGQGFETTLSSSDTTAGCANFGSVFAGEPAIISRVLDVSSLDLKLHTIYRPARWVSGEKYPLVVWGNGTCMQPEAYGGHLRSLASQGFIVVAPNSRYVASGSPDALTLALNFAIATNDNPQSAYYGRIDTTKIGAMGHSQGGMQVINLASDSRIRAVMIFNGGRSATKPFLVVSGDNDVAGPTSADLQTSVSSAAKAAYIYYHMVATAGVTFGGYLTVVMQPERVTGPTNAWWKLLLNNDASARSWFVGSSCMLCNRANDVEFGQIGL